MTEQWQAAQQAELIWWEWFLNSHLPWQTREELVAYRYCEGRYMLRQCGFREGEYYPGGSHILDLGCGAVSVHECRRGVRVTAVDPLLAALAASDNVPTRWAARLGAVNNAIYISATGEALRELFDHVWCYNVLDHTANWRDFLLHACTLVAPGGTLTLCADCRVAGDLDDGFAEDPMHIQAFNHEELHQAISLGGLSAFWSSPHPRGAQILKYRYAIRATRPYGAELHTRPWMSIDEAAKMGIPHLTILGDNPEEIVANAITAPA